MENTTLTTKIVFILTTDVNPTPLVIDIMDIDVAWHTRMDTFAYTYASSNGYTAQHIQEKNYGRTVELRVVHNESAVVEQWTIHRSQPAHFDGDVSLNNASRKCMQPMFS